ncbi:MAG: hypothetical protein P8M12_04625 [Flavobacteriales bacterium]|nr:hypothetical protein [Flavobacteriales bacterium]
MKFNKIYIQQNIACLFVFIFILIISMLLYPGGAKFNTSATHYLFFENFISHLGKDYTFNGAINFFPAALFKIGVYLISFSFAILFLFQPLIFKTHSLSFKMSVSASCLALCSALAFIGIGYYSADPFTLKIHLAFVKISFYLFFMASLIQTIAIKVNPLFNKKMFLYYLFFSISLLAYNLLIEFGPRPNANLLSLVIQVSAQKLIATLFFINFIVQGRETLKIIKHIKAF